jgi:hypothetical protein
MVFANVIKDTGYGLYTTGTHGVIKGHPLGKVSLQGVLISITSHLATVTLHITNISV